MSVSFVDDAAMAGERLPDSCSSLERLLARARAAAHWRLDGPALVVDRAIRRDGEQPGDSNRRARVGRLALTLPARLDRLNLPPSVRARYPDALRRLERTIADRGPYDPQDYAKDVRLAIGASVPAGAQAVDLNDRAGSAVVARRLVRHSALALRLAAAGELGHALHLALVAQGRPWLQHHTDRRSLEAFDELGWRGFHLTAADLLEARPEAAGIYGASWFYDPQIPAISPKLAYLQDYPVRYGALQVQLQTEPQQVQMALQRSPTRLRLFEGGVYRPACYALLWPRADLLAWAADERARTSALITHS